MTEEEKRKAVEDYLDKQLDDNDGDNYGDDSEMEELEERSPMIGSIAQKLKESNAARKVKFCDLRVVFEPNK